MYNVVHGYVLLCLLRINRQFLVDLYDSFHYNDVTMSAMASQLITSLTIVYSTVYSRRRSKKTTKLCITGLCAGNSPVTGEFPAQRASNAENVSIWWRHHVSTDWSDTWYHVIVPVHDNAMAWKRCSQKLTEPKPQQNTTKRELCA